jgi:hypothetical protein
MDKKELVDSINKSEEEINDLSNIVKNELKDRNELITPTQIRGETGLHHDNYTDLIDFLLENDEEVVSVPSTSKGELIAHKDNVKQIVKTGK